ITERFVLSNYKNIYDNISSQTSIASILEYPHDSDSSNTVTIDSNKFVKGKSGVGIIGAGNFTKMTMLPALKGAKANLLYIASASGVSGTSLAKKHGIAKSTTDFQEILKDDAVDLILITTRHNQHASMVLEGLQNGKNIFVEKPLALNENELMKIINGYNGS